MCLQAAYFGTRVGTPEHKFAVVMRACDKVVTAAPSDLGRRRWQVGDAEQLLNRRAIKAPDRNGRWVRAEAVVASHKALAHRVGSAACTGPLHKPDNARKFHSCKFPGGPGLPHDHQAVRAARDQPPGVDCHAARPDSSAVAPVAAQALAIRETPDANDLVLPACEEQVAITVPCDERDRAFVAMQCIALGLTSRRSTCGTWCYRCLGICSVQLLRLLALEDLRRLATLAHLPHLLWLRHLLNDCVEIHGLSTETTSLPHSGWVRIPAWLQPRDAARTGGARLGAACAPDRARVHLVILLLLRAAPHEPREEGDEDHAQQPPDHGGGLRLLEVEHLATLSSPRVR
mmetsp:Transcript_143141/g.398867  ORF Transcript_143141/g.398867 Transcript_143141/m.398867 type:complete len:345 (-) Transcript_143141:131-1165(-)